MTKEFFTIDQVAEKLGVHPKTIRRYISNGKMAAKKIAGSWRIAPEALNVFFNACGNLGSSQLVESKNDIFDFMNSESFDPNEEFQTSAVIYYRFSDEAVAKTLLKDVMAVVAEHSLATKKSKFSFECRDSSVMRLILSGSPSFLYDVMGTVKKYENATN